MSSPAISRTMSLTSGRNSSRCPSASITGWSSRDRIRATSSVGTKLNVMRSSFLRSRELRDHRRERVEVGSGEAGVELDVADTELLATGAQRVDDLRLGADQHRW